jgi:hypothetical protein
MDAPLALGLIAAGGAALAVNGSYLVQARALGATPVVSATRPLATLGGLLRSPSWRAGAALGYGGLALEIVALALAPVALVQSVLAAGLVVVAVGSARVARHRPARREAIAVGLMVAALVGLSVGPAAHAPAGPPPAAALAGFAALVAAACLLTGRRAGASPVRLGIVAGALYGVTTIALAAWLSAWRAGTVLGAAALVAMACAAVVTAGGFFAFQRALQAGRPVPVVTAMTAAMNVVAIAGGLVLLGDGIGRGAWQPALHLAAYCAVPIAAALAAPALSPQHDPNPAAASPNPAATTLAAWSSPSCRPCSPTTSGTGGTGAAAGS